MNDGQMNFFGDASAGAVKPVKFQIRRSYNASLETVFDAWLIPYLVGSWMFGPKSGTQEVIALENKPLPGGNFLLEVVRADGQRRLTGTYREIRRPEKLQCTIGEESDAAPLTLLTMELTADEGKTRMKLGFELHPKLADQADALRAEWTSRCKTLAELVEKSSKQTRLLS